MIDFVSNISYLLSNDGLVNKLVPQMEVEEEAWKGSLEGLYPYTPFLG